MYYQYRGFIYVYKEKKNKVKNNYMLFFKIFFKELIYCF